MQLDGRPVTVDELAALALTNYGHYTSMRVEDGGVRGLSLHLDRLVRDCRTVLDAELDPGHVRALVRRALDGVARPIVVRVTVFDPGLDAGGVGGDAEPHVLVTTRSAPDLPAAPLRLRTARGPRPSPEVKHVAVFGALHQRRLAQRAGYDDVVLVDESGRLCELATSNLGVILDGTVLWPDTGALGGITATLLTEVHDGPVTVGPITEAELDGVEAPFAVNAVVGVRAIAAIDERSWAVPHPLVDALRSELDAIAPEPL